MKKQVYNPYLPLYEYIPDGEPHVFEGRLYIYGSHDQYGAFSFCHNDYVTWSAPLDDLSDWRYEGVIYRKDQDPDNSRGKKNLFAPDVVKGYDGKYYLYYSFDFTGKIGVAVSDSPKGPFTYYGHVRYKTGKEIGTLARDHFYFDPGVINDRGTVYLYAGFGPDHIFPQIRPGLKADGCYCMKLAEDMLTVEEGPVKVFEKKGKADPSFEGHEFFEASSIRRVGNLYYFIYSSIRGHELCYALASSPYGPFEYKGTIVSNGDVGIDGRKEKDAVYPLGNNHGSIIRVNDRWYVFYHRHTNYTNTDRQGLAERIYFDKNGDIKQVETTSSGINDGPLKGDRSYPASICCYLRPKEGNVFYPFFKMRKSNKTYITQSGEDFDTVETQYIKNVMEGCVIGYKYFDLSLTSKISLVCKGKAKGRVSLRFSPEGEDYKTADFESDGEEEHTVSFDISERGDKEAIYFCFESLEGKTDVYRLEFEISEEE